eukprot:GHVS01097259.1.p1 GENE.GHVS01097259.1~~GHVS01097259.1.p1  ORF type:complete len:340 (+),score=32.44 GHVS01097259.1:30-1049(+)
MRIKQQQVAARVLFAAFQQKQRTFVAKTIAPSPVVASSVKLVEVGPRDGLQNEKRVVTAQTKAKFIGLLADSGLKCIEAGSFVNPKWVPQMADTAEVLNRIEKRPGVSYPVLVPNMKGFELARQSGVSEVAVFSAASETFTQKNTNCSIGESLESFHKVIQAAINSKIVVRGYVSCVMGCPFEGPVSAQSVVHVVKQLIDSGCYEVSLGDTIGTGTAGSTARLLDALDKAQVPFSKLAVHFHDSYGQALANVLTAIQMGISVVDSSVAGLGGCPYAVVASGNVATEEVVYMLQGMGIDTGVDIEKLIGAGEFICKELGRASGSKVGVALKNKTYLLLHK